ncbi:MAG: GTP pyrophosphokinase, partial [Peptostreptococcaceae bacterium]|nr:GTP pyrophosphokinase [Peptostreptococcaceae bacterium]
MLRKHEFMNKYQITEEYLEKNNINWDNLVEIYEDYTLYRKSYETQAELIATILRNHPRVHSVKTRVKDPDHLIEKIIRKSDDRRKKYGNDFNFNVENYKDEITDLVGIRVIHIFKE